MKEPGPEVVDAEIVPSHGSRAPAMGLDLPEDPATAIEVLLEEVENARGEATTYLDDLRRVAADFDNFRKRTLREQSTILDRAAERVVRELLPVLDTFDAALAVEAATDGERQLIAGMAATRDIFLRTLEKEGLEVIEPVGQPFDPELHEPIGPSEGDGEPIVGAELRRGYKLGGRVLRAALVSLETRG